MIEGGIERFPSNEINIRTITCNKTFSMGENEEIIDFDYTIGVCRVVLRAILGIWPEVHKEKNIIFRYRFIIPAMLMLCFCNIPQTSRAIEVWGDLNQFLEVVTTADIPIGVSLFKMLCLWYKGDGQLVVMMSEDWKSFKTPEELDIMKKNAKLSRLMSIIIIFLAEITVTIFLVKSIFIQIEESLLYRSGTVNTSDWQKSYYLSSRFCYDAQSTPNFEITWILQFFSAFFAALAFSSIDAFFAVLVLHLCGQLRILSSKLRSLSKYQDNKEFNYVVASIVRKHNALGRFANTIEEAFNIMFLVQIMISSLVLCLQGYQVVVIFTNGGKISIMDLVFMIYFSALFTFSAFLYCYVAETLLTESTGTAYAAYEGEWYNLSPEKSRLLLFIIVRAKMPFKLSAGKFVAFSLQLFCSILKSSGGYLSMLLAIRERLTA